MSTTFQHLIHLITNGESVDETTINRVLSTLDSNTKYLLSLLTQASIGSAIFARQVSVDESTTVGTPVYYDPDLGRFMPGVAEIDSNGSLTVSRRSQIWGVVYVKHNTTSADLLVSGYADLDISDVVDGPVVDGAYYLSASQPGQLVLQSQSVTVPVLQVAGDKVNVRIRFYDPASEHRHYRFDLVAYPAGETEEPNTTSDPHVITSPDADVEGWLPADNAVFGGLAPAGAVFGYNISASSFSGLWPPVPVDHAALIWNRGLDSEIGGTEVQTTASGHAVLDQNGIWWMTDCYGEVPWPTDLDTSAGPTPTTTLVPCPHAPEMQLTVYYSRLVGTGSDTVVTSIKGDPSGRIRVVCENDSSQDKSTGRLMILLDLDLATDPDDDAAGDLVFKALDSNGVFHRGPVVEKISSANSRIVISSSRPDGIGGHQGVAVITAVDTPVGTSIPIEALRLEGSAAQHGYQGLVAYNFPVNRLSSIRCRFGIPSGIVGVSVLKLRLRFVLLARAAGNLPALTAGYRLVPTVPNGTQLTLPTSETALAIDTSVGAGIDQDDYVSVLSAEFNTAPGDIVLFSLTRDSSAGDGFSGDLMLLGMSADVTGIEV